MNSDSLIDLTKKMIHEFCKSGNIENILALSADDVIGFSCHIPNGAVGKKAFEEFLHNEYTYARPCHIIDMSTIHMENVGENIFYVRCDIIIYIGAGRGIRYYNVMYVYNQIDGKDLKIKGIYIIEATDNVKLYFDHLVAAAKDDSRSISKDYIHIAHIVYSVGETSRLLYYNDAFADILGYELEDKDLDAVKSLDDLIVSKNLPEIRRKQQAQIEKSHTCHLHYKLYGKDGKIVPVVELGCFTENKDNEFVVNSAIIGLAPFENINRYFWTDVFFDKLTGIYKEDIFYTKTRALLEENKNKEFEITCFDISRFKVINELFGREAGNQLLKKIAETLGSYKMQDFVYARFYADKFVLFYPAENNNRDNIISLLQEEVEKFKKNYKIILYFGVYPVRDRSLSVSEMCDKANMALRKIKGRYRIVCKEYDEDMHKNLIDEQSFINDMNRALKDKEFLFYLQPKYELSTEKIIGAEALVRWKHPTKGFIGPNRFIPIFEQNGFILELDKYIWESVCKLLHCWKEEGKPLHPISVNVSRADLYDRGLVDFLANLVKKYDVPPRMLELELTESAYIDDSEQIITITQKLQELGFIILMDDFGSGYSSLNMLKDVNVNILKVDLKFLQDNGKKSNRSGRILNSVVHMVKCLDIPIIIEGVETQQQAQFLRSIGCNWVQGYYYSRPVPVNEYEKLTDSVESVTDVDVKAPSLPVGIEDFFAPNAKFNLLFNSITCGIGIYEFSNKRLHLLRANDSYFYMFKCSIEKISSLNDNMLDYVHEEDRLELLNAVQKACDTEDIATCHIRRYKADSKLVPLLVHISFIVKENDYNVIYMSLEKVEHYDSIYTEIQKVFDNIPACLGIFEMIGDEIWARQVSKQFTQLTEYPRKEFVALSGGNMRYLLDEETLGKFKEAIQTAYKNEQAIAVKVNFTTRMEKEITIFATLTAIKSRYGSLLCYMYAYGE